MVRKRKSKGRIIAIDTDSVIYDDPVALKLMSDNKLSSSVRRQLKRIFNTMYGSKKPSQIRNLGKIQLKDNIFDEYTETCTKCNKSRTRKAINQSEYFSNGWYICRSCLNQERDIECGIFWVNGQAFRLDIDSLNLDEMYYIVSRDHHVQYNISCHRHNMYSTGIVNARCGLCDKHGYGASHIHSDLHLYNLYFHANKKMILDMLMGIMAHIVSDVDRHIGLDDIARDLYVKLLPKVGDIIL